MKNHSLIMILCCLIPVAILGVLVLFGVELGTALFLGILVLCPLMHFLMMRRSGEDHGHHA